MDKKAATQIFECLSSGVRLDVFRLLVKNVMSGMVAGEVATTLDIAPTNLSFHLKALSQAGLVSATPEGRYQRYRANLPVMLEIIAYLTEECCGGSRQQCAPDAALAACCDVPATRAAKPRAKRSR